MPATSEQRESRLAFCQTKMIKNCSCTVRLYSVSSVTALLFSPVDPLLGNMTNGLFQFDEQLDKKGSVQWSSLCCLRLNDSAVYIKNRCILKGDIQQWTDAVVNATLWDIQKRETLWHPKGSRSGRFIQVFFIFAKCLFACYRPVT